MNEFRKLEWDTTSDPSYLEKQACCFIPDELLLDSYVYQNLKRRLPKEKKVLGLCNAVSFFPGKKYQPRFSKSSSLSKQQLEHCLNALKLINQNKSTSQLKQTESYSLEVYNKLSGKLAAENAAFNQFVKNSWESDRVTISRLKNNLYKYGLSNYHKKVQRYLEYGNFYKEESLLSTTCTEQENVTVEVNCINNLLELGTLARFSQPSLKFECRLSAQTLPSTATNIRSNSKFPVSKDENIRQLLNENDFDIVISSSGLKRLLDNTDPKSKWTIPVTIEMINMKRGNGVCTKKVVFIDKPLVSSRQDPLDLKYYSMKRLVKTNFCQYEAFSFEKQDTYPDEKLANLNEKLIELEKQMSDNSYNSKESTEMSQNKEGKDDEMMWKKKKNKPDIIHHNVNYRVWRFKQIVNNNSLMKNQLKNTELNLLVRSKLDGCETTPSGSLQPVIVKPKIELQLQYGANIPTKSELSREWTSLFFRPFSNLYRVRLHWDTAEVVSIEKCTLQKVMSEATSLYQYNPYLGLGMLNNLFNELRKFQVGNYLLVHHPKHEFFISVLVECESPLSTLKLHSEVDNCEIEYNIKRNWVPIDLNYILPIHEFEKRPPGCFYGALRFKKKGGVGKPKKKKNPSKKNKTNDTQNKSLI